MRGVAIATLLAVGFGAQAAGMRSASHEGYVRLVFDTDIANPSFTVAQEGSDLVIRFAQPFRGDLDAGIAGRLQGWIGRGRLSDDRRSASFPLLRPVQLKSFANDKSAVVDLIAAKPGETPAAAPVVTPAPVTAAAPSVAPAAKSVEAPRADAFALPVRVGIHPDYTRLVFEWDRAVDYRASGDAGAAQIAFQRPAQIDAAQLQSRLPKAVASPSSRISGSETMLNLAIPAGARIRHFRNGQNIVVDILTAPDATPVAASSVPAQAPVAAQVSEPPKVAAAPAVPARSAAVVPAPTAAAPAANPAAATAASTTSAPVVQAPAIQAAPTVPARLPAVVPAPAPALPASLPPVAVEVKAPLTVQPVAAQAGRNQTIRLPFATMPSAALFQRGNQLYLVFDRPVTFDLSRLKRAGEPAQSADPLAISDAGALQFVLPANTSAQLDRDAAAWVLSLKPGQPSRRPDVPLAVSQSGSGDQGMISIPALRGAGPITVPDHDKGIPFLVVPLPDAGRGVEGDRSYAQFNLLASQQGIVVSPKADNVIVRVTPDQVVVSGGLALSRGTAPGRSRIYDFARWNQPDVDFVETRQALQRTAAEADPAQRPAALFELSQFLLARDHAIDAIGVIDLISANAPGLADDPSLRALRGAARVMREEGSAALADLSDPRLEGETEALMWRGAAAAETGDMAKADQLFRRVGVVPPAHYPNEMRWTLALLAGDAALRTGDYRRSRAILDQLANPDVPATIRARSELLRAKGYMAQNDRRSAAPILERLVVSDDRPTRVQAQRIKVEQQLADKTIPVPDAIDTLEKIRFAWSGGDLEYDTLKRLGDLYLQNGDVRSALERWRDATTYFPDRPDTEAIKAKMVDAFSGLYSDDRFDSIPPLGALALYDDFRDLTPPGARGDLMIQRLADRLVAIDLLDRAAELLEHQVKNRLKGADKARVGARLAVVRLLDRKPQDALAALAMSEAEGATPEIVSERRRLKAQAQMESGDTAAAIATLEGDTSREADRLRADIYSKAQNWPLAAQVLTRLVGNPQQGDFDVPRQRTVLNLAIARALSGDGDGLRQLRDQFGQRMDGTPNKQAFDLLTSGNNVLSGSAGADKTGLAIRFTELAEMQSAMSSYREKLRGGGLSSIN